jgi:iron complex transport system substrate-binding protein
MLLGQVTGLEDQAARITGGITKRQEELEARVAGLPAPSVFWELSDDLWTAGPGSYIDDLIRIAGGRNIAADAESPWAQLSAEVLIEQNPAFIFLADHPFGATVASVSERPGWQGLIAVQQGQIIEIGDVDLLSRPGPRVMEALEFILCRIHPGVCD